MDFKKFKKNRNKVDMKKKMDSMKDEKSNYDDDRFWSPSIDKNRVGNALIRFLPQQDADMPPVIKKFVHSIKHKGKWFIENCPCTIDEPCPCDEYSEHFFDMNTEQMKTIAFRYFKKKQFIGNILVIKDPKEPENDGKVFLYKFPVTVFEKIMDKICPESELDKEIPVFDLWNGMNFKLKIRDKKGWVNYEKSEFVTESTPVAKDDDGIEEIYNQLVELKEFLNVSQFKSYDKLKARLVRIVDDDEIRKFFGVKTKGKQMEDVEPDKEEEKVEEEVKDVEEKTEKVDDDLNDVDFNFDDDDFNFDDMPEDDVQF